MSILMDKYNVHGNELEMLRKTNEELEAKTKELVVKGYQMDFYSYCPLPSLQEEGKQTFYILRQEYIKGFLEGDRIHIGKFKNDIFGNDEILNELKETSGLVIVIDKTPYIVSQLALPTFTLRAEVKGDMTIQRNNLIRDLHLADAIYDKNENIHLVYREEEVNGVMVRKIFAGLGNAYKLVPQTIITKAIDKIAEAGTVGEPKLSFFEADHLYTTAELILPEIGESLAEEYKLKGSIMPGLYLSTSDVGASSVIIRGIYKKGSSTVITDEVMMKHAGNKITPESILAEADENIFAGIRKLPEVLSELIGREVTDYSKLDLTIPDHCEKNFKAVYDILKKEINRVGKEAKLSGKKKQQLLECMADEINSELHYTLYDIAVDFMGVPSRVTGLDRDTVVRLQKACGQTPFKLSKSVAVFAGAEDEDVVLTPA